MDSFKFTLKRGSVFSSSETLSSRSPKCPPRFRRMSQLPYEWRMQVALHHSRTGQDYLSCKNVLIAPIKRASFWFNDHFYNDRSPSPPTWRLLSLSVLFNSGSKDDARDDARKQVKWNFDSLWNNFYFQHTLLQTLKSSELTNECPVVHQTCAQQTGRGKIFVSVPVNEAELDKAQQF